jgi:hypothetical protein
MQSYSVPLQALGLVEPAPSFSSLSPPFRRRPDVHLSLTSGWVHLGLNSCRIQTVCLHLIGSVLMFSPIVLSLSFLVFRFRVPRFSFLVSRSSFAVTRFSACLPVSRSSLSVRYHGVAVAVDLYVFLVFYSFVYSLFVPPSRRHDVHLLLMSRMGSG